MNKYTIILLLSSLIGCSSLKEDVGQYVEEAVRQKITSDVDNILEKRGLSLKELKQAISTNPEGTVTKADVISTAKEMTKDYVLLEAKKYVEEKMKDNEAKIQQTAVSRGDLESKTREFWQLVLGLVAAYLTKQLYSAKSDHERDKRLTILEKLLDQDDEDKPTPATPKVDKA